MKKNFGPFFLKTTVAGLFALLPFLVIVILLIQVYKFAHQVGANLANDPSGEGSGALLLTISVILSLVLFCFLFGLLIVPRGTAGVANWLEKNLLGNIPGYMMLKGMASSLLADGDQFRPATLERLPGVLELVLLIEKLPDDRYTVFLPTAPGSSNGTVLIVREELLQPLDAGLMDLKDTLSLFGFGAESLMKQKKKASSV